MWMTGESRNGVLHLQVKQQVLLSATEAAEMILRVDEIIKCAPRQRQE
jgi:T-complex protein 1 subunit beta